MNTEHRSYEPYMHLFSFMQTFPSPATNLISLGIEKRNDEYYYDNNFRNIQAYLFQYTLEGEGILEFDGVKYTMKKNEGFYIKIPGNSRYYLPKNSKTGWTFLFILIESGIMEEYYKRTIEKSRIVFQLPIHASLITYLFDKIEETKAGFITDFSTASSTAFEFMNRMYFTFATEQLNYSNRVLRAINEMENRFSTLEGTKELADFLQLSENHFIREFKENVGITPTKYLNNIKIAHAKRLLTTSNMSVEQISAACNYSNANYFCRVFKKHTGMTPLSYRYQKNNT